MIALTPEPSAAGLSCAGCASPLAHDQRYCLRCGERAVPLPPHVAALLGQGPRAGEAPPDEIAELGTDADDDATVSMVSPRAAAVAVLAILAFGSLIGSIAAPPATSEASAPVVVALAPAAPEASPSQDAAAPDAPETADAPTGGDTPLPDADTAAPDVPSGGDSTGSGAAPGMTVVPDGSMLPDVRHVFLIVLSGHGADDAFGPSSEAPYLATTLRSQGELVSNYYSVTQGELANSIALISGQGPTPQTAAGCPRYVDVSPGTLDEHGQVLGDGCVYPATALTLGDQLDAAGRTWKAYVEDMGHAPAGEATACRHPAAGAADPDTAPRPGDGYVTWRNPYVYFHAITDGSRCAADDVDLGQLDTDLASARTTPTVSYIVPSRCHDGGDDPCAPGQDSGLKATDAFLRTLVPKLQRSAAYREGGLIAITFDEGPATGPGADQGSCCNAPLYPNLASAPAAASVTAPASTNAPASTSAPAATAAPTTASGTTPSSTAPAPTTGAPASTSTPAATAAPGAGVATSSPGGGRVGLLLLSPFVKPGSVNMTDSYNHFSLLRSIEDLFGLDHLGYAADPTVSAFDKVIYNAAPKAKP